MTDIHHCQMLARLYSSPGDIVSSEDPVATVGYNVANVPLSEEEDDPGRHTGELRAPPTPPLIPVWPDGKNSFKIRPRPGPYHGLITHTATQANLNYTQPVTSPTQSSTTPALHHGREPLFLLVLVRVRGDLWLLVSLLLLLSILL